MRLLTPDSLAPIRNDAAGCVRVHRPHGPARRSRCVAADTACGARRDRTTAVADRGSATQPVWPPLGTARRRGVPTRGREPGTVAGRAGGQAGCGVVSRGDLNAGADASAASHRTGQTQPWRIAGASAADRGGDRRRGQGLPLLRGHVARHRRRPGGDARLRACPVAGPSNPSAAVWLPSLRGGGRAGASAGASH